MNRDILFREPDFIFSYRITGILIHNGKVLLQKPKDDDYAFPGGHVAALEDSRKTLIREFGEETRAAIEVDNLMAVGEVFFPWGDHPCHQIGLYYYVHLADNAAVPKSGIFPGYDECDNVSTDLDFCWIPLEQLNSIPVYPPNLVPHILKQDGTVLHFVYRES